MCFSSYVWNIKVICDAYICMTMDTDSQYRKQWQKKTFFTNTNTMHTQHTYLITTHTIKKRVFCPFQFSSIDFRWVFHLKFDFIRLPHFSPSRICRYFYHSQNSNVWHTHTHNIPILKFTVIYTVYTYICCLHRRKENNKLSKYTNTYTHFICCYFFFWQ